MKTANILDPISAELTPKVFDNPADDNPTLKPVHRKWIMGEVNRILEDGGYENIDEWLSLVFTGSLTTYQYSDDSDVDISLFVDVEHFPDWARGEMIGLMVDKMDGVTLPGTPYPMQCFVVPSDVSREDLYKPGLRSGYDLDKNEWIVPPDRERVRDVKTEMSTNYIHALQAADKMERLLKFEPRSAIRYWHQIHRRRRRDMKKGKGDYHSSNIDYKMLANRGLFPAISETTGEYIAKVTSELHIGLDLPKDVTKKIHKWVKEQDWPEGTELEDPGDYHITLVYAEDGHEDHADDEWRHAEKGYDAEVSGLDLFGKEEKKAIVLKIKSPDVVHHAEDVMEVAEDRGIEINKFPGRYKPHITVAYGPSKPKGSPLKLKFKTGPSSVSEPRTTGVLDSTNSLRYNLQNGQTNGQTDHDTRRSGAEISSSEEDPRGTKGSLSWVPDLAYAQSVNQQLHTQDGAPDLYKLRDRGFLEHTLGQAAQQSDPISSAVTLAHGIAYAQPFRDGNKRTGLVLAQTLLNHHGLENIIPYQNDEGIKQHLLGVVKGTHSFDDMHNLLKSRASERRTSSAYQTLVNNSTLEEVDAFSEYLAENNEDGYSIDELDKVSDEQVERWWEIFETDGMPGVHTSSVNIAEVALEGVHQNDGITISLDGVQPTSGYAFSPFKGLETIIPVAALKEEDIQEFIDSNQQQLAQPDNNVGIWVSGLNAYIDVTQVEQDFDIAYKKAWDADQLAMWDIVGEEEIPVRDGGLPPLEITSNFLHDASRLASSQVAKFVYSPVDNYLVVGGMAKEEGEVESHADLLKRSGLPTAGNIYGQFDPSGRVQTFGRPKIEGFGNTPSMTPYEAEWRAKQALEQTIPGVQFKAFDPKHTKWDLSGPPKVTYMREPPVIGQTPMQPESDDWTFA